MVTFCASVLGPLFLAVNYIQISAAMRSSDAVLKDTVIDEIQQHMFQDSNSSTAVSGFKCPSQCSQCCEADAIVGKNKKFKCVLRKADNVPEDRNCGSVHKRRSSPSQHKVDCDFKQSEGSIRQPQCSKTTRCCCSMDQVMDLHNFPAAKLDDVHDAFCAPYSELGEGKQFSNSKAGVVEIYSLETFWKDDTENTCSEHSEAGIQYSCYRRTVLMSGGMCMTDFDGLLQVGNSYICPGDMIGSLTKENLNCLCDDDC
jgi:hypothetical protein